MSGKLDLSRYNKLIKEIEKHNKFYYEKSSPKISDRDYDNLKKKLVIFEKKNKFLKKNSSPTNKVGYKPSKNFIKHNHRLPMLSLSNAFDFNDLLNFEKKIFNYINDKIKFLTGISLGTSEGNQNPSNLTKRNSNTRKKGLVFGPEYYLTPQHSFKLKYALTVGQ